VQIAPTVAELLGGDLPVAVEAYDGSRAGPADATTTLVVRGPEAVRRIVAAPGELGFGRAYVAGDLEVRGDMFDALRLRDALPDVRLGRREWLLLLRLAREIGLRPIPAPPPEEIRLQGRLHSKERDREAVSYHYDVSPAFYRLVLGPSMTYSCAVFARADGSLEDAQAAKHELVAGKLALRPGMRLLDVGCGWGSMLIHAAAHHRVHGVGVTLSERQADVARKRVVEAGVADLVDIRVLDYRDVDDGPYDAISSIGMFEHVGRQRMREYVDRLHALLVPGGRLLNHGISRPARAADETRGQRVRRVVEDTARSIPGAPLRPAFGAFVQHYVFPDGELHEVGSVVTTIQDAGFEVRHVESLREHYALTLRRWVANLEAGWDDAVAEAGANRARIWRLYMAASAINFEAGRTSIHQVLAVKPVGGVSGMPLRPDWTA
jgi:cyclopropane-fatty-acyl-phospholipid synthase